MRTFSRDPVRLNKIGRLIDDIQADGNADDILPGVLVSSGPFSRMRWRSMTRKFIDLTAEMALLKDFQRRTVKHAFRRLYRSQHGSRRFLVADEVGLGKTLVARGIVAQAIDHLEKKGVERINIVYVCSNAAIALQNVNRLNLTGKDMLPRRA